MKFSTLVWKLRSPIVYTIILIAIAVALGIAVAVWASTFAQVWKLFGA